MLKVTFYTHVADPAAFACRLAARALQGGRVLVWLESEAAAAQLDLDLWRFEPTSFLAHEMWRNGAYPSDVPLLVAGGEALPEQCRADVVLNLSPDLWCDADPAPARVLEIVGSDLEALAEARLRFQAYRQRGFTIEHHNMQQHTAARA